MVLKKKGGPVMTAEECAYRMWIDWEEAIVSFHPVSGFEQICFSSRESYQARVQILVQSGFRFQ